MANPIMVCATSTGLLTLRLLQPSPAGRPTMRQIEDGNLFITLSNEYIRRMLANCRRGLCVDVAFLLAMVAVEIDGWPVLATL